MNRVLGRSGIEVSAVGMGCYGQVPGTFLSAWHLAFSFLIFV